MSSEVVSDWVLCIQDDFVSTWMLRFFLANLFGVLSYELLPDT